ncbi:hypothetical protein HU200_021947 [Digitaria exilis]|uniref:glutathione-disulfide reductase n=1 Tax=Digitaria exilis TaxID=1010633 RepID=A0A835C4S7_9POAL|nr:hypothetical protein HU200_021947 [Digitaria exilis]
MAAATLPPASSSAAAAAVRSLARAVPQRHQLLLHASRRGRGHRHPLPLTAVSPWRAHLRRALSVSASGGSNGAAPVSAEREYDYDLFTIGAGSGGMRASRAASALYGARAAVCEMPFATVASDALGGVGGTCVLRGCVPKKLLVYASNYSHEFEESRGFGWMYETDPKHDWRTLITNKNLELQRLVGIQTNTLKNSGVTMIEGRGKIVDPHTVCVDGKLYTAKNILVAVGGRPSKPNIPGIEHAIDSDAALDLPSRPEKIAIVGGGYIALEFAGIFNGLKSDVHVFIRQNKVLRGFDEEVRDFVAEQMSLRGVKFHIEQTPQAVTKSDDGSLSLKTNKETISGFSHVMFATGRKPNTKVDEYSRTSVDSIWAVEIAVPSAVFSQPPIGQVGLTEDKAIETYGDIDVYTSNFKPLRATLSGLPDRVFMKVIVCSKTNKVLGVHMCGEDAPEIIQGIAIAVKAGLTKQNFDSTIGVHPTTAEEIVTMRNPTRKVQRDTASEVC